MDFQKSKILLYNGLQETHLVWRTHRLNVKGLKKILQANGKKKARLALLRKDFKTITKEKTLYGMRGWICQDSVTIIYVSNIRTLIYIINFDRAKGRNNNTIVWDFSMPLSVMDTTSKWEINKETVLNKVD